MSLPSWNSETTCMQWDWNSAERNCSDAVLLLNKTRWPTGEAIPGEINKETLLIKVYFLWNVSDNYLWVHERLEMFPSSLGIAPLLQRPRSAFFCYLYSFSNFRGPPSNWSHCSGTQWHSDFDQHWMTTTWKCLASGLGHEPHRDSRQAWETSQFTCVQKPIFQWYRSLWIQCSHLQFSRQ